MCELLGISSSVPVRVTYSLHAFAEHGGLIHPNKSGWGIAYHEGKDALLIKEPEPAADSPWVRFIESQPLRRASSAGTQHDDWPRTPGPRSEGRGSAPR
jgi:glutamine amidotransferase